MGIRTCFLSLLVVDAAEYQGAYCNQIYNRATERGLGSLVSDYSCDKIASDTVAPYSSGAKINSILGKEEAAQEQSSSSSSSGWCGSIAGALHRLQPSYSCCPSYCCLYEKTREIKRSVRLRIKLLKPKGL